MGWYPDPRAYCWGSTDREHRFWLLLHGGVRVCINCHAERKD